jgi:phosphate transport system permease protein
VRIVATPTSTEPITGRSRGQLGDSLFRWLCIAAGLSVLAILALIAGAMIKEAWPALSSYGGEFLTSTTWNPNNPEGAEFGALAYVYGTAVVSLIALVLAVPVSLGIALFATEVTRHRFSGPLISALDLLAAVPSVVFGLWGIAVLAPNVIESGFYDFLHDTLGSVPIIGALFGEPDASGRTMLTAGIVLALMIVPITTSIMREVLSTVPQGERDGALALGATRWEMVRGVVLPHSFGGLVGGVMLGLGRAMGETIAVALTVGGSAQVVANIMESGDTMPAVIVNQFGESSGDFRSALIALGVVLFAMTIVVNIAARAIVNRAELRMRGHV